MEEERMEGWKRKEGEPEPQPLVLRLTAGPESGNTGVSSSDVELGPCWCLHSGEQAHNSQLPAAPGFPPYTWGDATVRGGMCLGDGERAGRY